MIAAIRLVLVALVLAGPVVADNAVVPSHVPGLDTIPDLTQTDPRGNFSNGGRTFCGPVAVSNSLMMMLAEKLAEEDLSHYDLVNRLASLSCMKTHDRSGTSVKQLMRGVERFLDERGEQNYYLKFQGWRRHDVRHRTNVNEPRLDWIKRLLSRGGAVWLNVGWYRRTSEEGVYYRMSGHWVTAVGYGRDSFGDPNPDYLVIHDPAPRAGSFPSQEFVKMARLESGKLTGKMRNLPRPARDLYSMEGGMHLKRGAHLAILDGAVGLRLSKRKAPR